MRTILANKLDFDQLIFDAKTYFNLTLHKDKICFAKNIDEP
jgi:hypothetical protein